MKALLIDVNFTTGERAGAVWTKGNANLYGNPNWQSRPMIGLGKEIRLIVDGNAEPYRGIGGVVVLESETEIDAACQAFAYEAYTVQDLNAVLTSIAENDIDTSDITDFNVDAEKLYNRGAAGIKHSVFSPPMAAEVALQAMGG